MRTRNRLVKYDNESITFQWPHSGTAYNLEVMGRLRINRGRFRYLGVHYAIGIGMGGALMISWQLYYQCQEPPPPSTIIILKQLGIGGTPPSHPLLAMALQLVPPPPPPPKKNKISSYTPATYRVDQWLYGQSEGWGGVLTAQYWVSHVERGMHLCGNKFCIMRVQDVIVGHSSVAYIFQYAGINLLIIHRSIICIAIHPPPPPPPHPPSPKSYM